MPDKKSAPGLRIINKTGNPIDTKIMVGGKDVTEELNATRVQVVLDPDNTVRAVIECIPGEIDLAALDGHGVLVDQRKARAEYVSPKAQEGTDSEI